MEVFVPRTVKIVTSTRKEFKTAIMPRISAPYALATIILVIRLTPVPITLAPKAQAEPVRISENFLSEMRLWNFRRINVIKIDR
jgi:hypothetical protein